MIRCVLLRAGRLWTFLEVPSGSRQDKVYALLDKLEDNIASSNWREWLLKAEDEKRQELFRHTLAHTITARPVARDAQIPGAGRTWGDAENDGFITLTGPSDTSCRPSEGSPAGIPQTVPASQLAAPHNTLKCQGDSVCRLLTPCWPVCLCRWAGSADA